MYLEEEQATKMRYYTQLRKQREEFRKRLVNLIVTVDENAEIGPDEIPSAEEREILRYYYYIRNGVDTIHVAPLDQNVLSRVGNYLLFKQYIQKLKSISFYVKIKKYIYLNNLPLLPNSFIIIIFK